MTAPVSNVRVRCPKCGRVYDDWYRASLNLGLDDFDADYIRQASTATCPECGFVVEFDSLIVEEGVWEFRRSDPDDPSFTERKDGPTPAGGAYSTADYVRGDSWEPCPKRDADRMIVREYDADDNMLKETVAAMGRSVSPETMGGEER